MSPQVRGPVADVGASDPAVGPAHVMEADMLMLADRGRWRRPRRSARRAEVRTWTAMPSRCGTAKAVAQDPVPGFGFGGDELRVRAHLRGLGVTL